MALKHKLHSAALAIFLGTGLAPGATYHVDVNGSDNAPCSEEAPCATIRRAASLARQAGDVVQVRPGTYRERVVLTAGGTVDGNIEFRGHDGTGCPEEQIQDPNSRGSRPAPSVTMLGFVVNASQISIDCFRVEGAGWGNGNGAFELGRRVSNVSVTNNVVDAAATPGSPYAVVNFGFQSSLSDMPSAIYVARNYGRNTAYGFLISCGGQCLIEDNEVESLKSKGPNSPPADNDYTRIFGERIVLRHNYFHGNNVADCTGCHIDCIQTWNIGRGGEVARQVVIDRNVCFNAHQHIIARDTTSKTAGAFDSHVDWIVTNNVFAFGPIGSTSHWCAAFDHIGNVVFEHNLCAFNGVVAYLNGSNGIHTNNIHYGSGWKPYTSQLSGDWSDGSVEGSNNLFFDKTYNYSGSGWPGNLVNRDPKFVDPEGRDFRIRADSPAKAAGVQVGVGVDLDGTPRPSDLSPAIGPFEVRDAARARPQPPAALRARVND